MGKQVADRNGRIQVESNQVQFRLLRISHLSYTHIQHRVLILLFCEYKPQMFADSQSCHSPLSAHHHRERLGRLCVGAPHLARGRPLRLIARPTRPVCLFLCCCCTYVARGMPHASAPPKGQPVGPDSFDFRVNLCSTLRIQKSPLYITEYNRPDAGSSASPAGARPAAAAGRRRNPRGRARPAGPAGAIACRCSRRRGPGTAARTRPRAAPRPPVAESPAGPARHPDARVRARRMHWRPPPPRGPHCNAPARGPGRAGMEAV